jgi:SPP1 family predicted phage head-tail adaptor
MRAGPLRQRITVQLLEEQTDAYGQRIPSWKAAGTFWAEVRQLTGREAENAKQRKAEATHLIRMRCVGTLFLPRGIDSTARFIFWNPPYETQIFNLLYVNDVDNRNREYQFTVQELPPAVAALS